ncbi:MAG TPA: TrmH family RNA methyltransferase [Terriglobales bacterium]|nr:TrmH family RNA methyltransferase [Terriglobales bacterium]
MARTVATQLDRLRLVLVRTHNPLNIGAAARAMSNFGVLHLRVVHPYDVAYREARSAMGAASLLKNAEEFASVADAVADCSLVVGTTAAEKRELHHPLKRLEAGAKLIRQRLRSNANVALLFGSEKRGLLNEDLAHCHWLMRIPTRQEHGSMNLGQAVAVTLYEIVRDAKAPATTKGAKAASAAEIERISTLLLDALRESGYLKTSSPPADDKIRRLVRRLAIPAEDAEVWLGIVRQILWKIRDADKR